METRTPIRFRNIFGILLVFVYFSLQTEALFNPENFQQKLIALYRVLDYIHNRTHQMNVDVTFGVTLTEIQSTLSDPNLWIKPIRWTRVFPRIRSNSSQLLSYLDVVELIWHGTPNETESNYCLSQIALNSLNGKCQIPATCIEILTGDDRSSGYPLTHRLLIIQVAKALGCRETESALFSYLIPTYCAKIFQDLINLEAWNFPDVGRDLMAEQIVLCGMEGFRKFVDKHYGDLILSWQHRSGCFSVFGFFRKPHQIVQRSSVPTDFGCDSHMTTVAAASISIFIRENIENAFDRV